MARDAFREKSGEDHFYGPWRGGARSSGGGPASEKGRGTKSERTAEMADRVGKENVGNLGNLPKEDQPEDYANVPGAKPQHTVDMTGEDYNRAVAEWEKTADVRPDAKSMTPRETEEFLSAQRANARERRSRARAQKEYEAQRDSGLSPVEVPSKKRSRLNRLGDAIMSSGYGSRMPLSTAADRARNREGFRESVPIRADSEFGLSPAQFAAMPERLRKKAATLRKGDDPDAASEAEALERDIPVWEQAAKEVAGKEGKYSITWSKVREADIVEDIGPDDVPEPDPDEEWDATAIVEEPEAEADEEPEAEPEELMESAAVLLREYGRRNSGADLGRLQQVHDLTVDLGAACDGHEDEDEDEAPEGVRERLVEVDASAPASPFTFRESSWGDQPVSFAEADAVFDDASREVWITPIRPGFGNKRDRFFYPSKTIREAVEAGRFDGVRMFANHPRKSDEKELPERSVRDWVGVIKETIWDEVRDRPRSRLKVLDRDAYERFKEAPEYIAFSVMGGGRARPGRVDGEEARVVESMDKVRSVDWVTEAGAGGAIDFAEAEYDEELDVDINALTIEQLREARPDLVEALILEEEPEAEQAAPALPPAPKAGPKAPPAATHAAPVGKYATREEIEALRAELSAMKVKEAKAEGRVVAQRVVEDRLRRTVLPRAARDYIVDLFREAAVGADLQFEDDDALLAAVENEIGAISRVTGNTPSRVKGLGATAETVPAQSLREAKEVELAERLGEEDVPDPDGGVKADGEGGSMADRLAERI
jgi:hypothetical protein